MPNHTCALPSTRCSLVADANGSRPGCGLVLPSTRDPLALVMKFCNKMLLMPWTLVKLSACHPCHDFHEVDAFSRCAAPALAHIFSFPNCFRRFTSRSGVSTNKTSKHSSLILIPSNRSCRKQGLCIPRGITGFGDMSGLYAITIISTAVRTWSVAIITGLATLFFLGVLLNFLGVGVLSS